MHLWGQEGAFYGQEGGALRARQVHFVVKTGASWEQEGGELARRMSDHARKVRFMVKKGGSTVS